MTVDYLRNIEVHFQFGIDVNHAGDSRYLDTNAALNAIAGDRGTTNASFLFTGDSVTQANSVATITCYITNVPGASINDFANFGLDSGEVYYGGYSASILTD